MIVFKTFLCLEAAVWQRAPGYLQTTAAASGGGIGLTGGKIFTSHILKKMEKKQ